MSFDEYCGEYYDPRTIVEHECKSCGRTWQLINRGYDEMWFCLGESMQSEGNPIFGKKCRGCLLDDMNAKHLIGYAEERGKRALVLRGMLSTGGSPLEENDPVIAWAWEAFRDSDKELLAEAVRDALWFERDEMIDYMAEAM